MTEQAREIVLHGFRIYVCNLCLDGHGAECWVPGCAFWAADVPPDEIASRLLAAFVNDDEATGETVPS